MWLTAIIISATLGAFVQPPIQAAPALLSLTASPPVAYAIRRHALDAVTLPSSSEALRTLSTLNIAARIEFLSLLQVEPAQLERLILTWSSSQPPADFGNAYKDLDWP